MLKPTAMTLQKTIMALNPVERLDRFLRNSTDQSGSRDPGFTPYSSPSQPSASQSDSPASSRKVWTWGEVAVDKINYCRQYGPIKTPEEKSEKNKGIWFIGAPHSENIEKGKQISNCHRWLLLGTKKWVPKEVMDGLPLDKLQKIINNWHQIHRLNPVHPSLLRNQN